MDSKALYLVKSQIGHSFHLNDDKKTLKRPSSFYSQLTIEKITKAPIYLLRNSKQIETI